MDLLPAGEPVLFVSPHLDDAVLSCGALMAAVADRCPTVVATVFTAAGSPPHTYAARRFLRDGGGGSAQTLYQTRRHEDTEVLSQLDAEPLHLGFPDALFRRRRFPAGAALVLPELAHRYPTYRYDIARGRVARGDRPMIADIVTAMSAAAARARVIFCPLGVGRHVDHLITREVGTRFPERVVYYSDFPYDQTSAPDRGFVARHRLTSWKWDVGIAEKARLIRGYRSQADGLFPGGVIPAAPEVYWSAGR
ncbi:PIG-L deacetylase family protein [Paractinoplanes deccanensis]|nr:PIG-L family deacetylase [Actinoplanes deccanensis]